LILDLLEKEPRRCPESADLVEETLQAILGAPGDGAARGPGRRSTIGSIAVLPLENLSGDPEQEYFAEGMTEALILTLAQIDAFRVASRTSVMRFKGTRAPLPEIARALQVDGVVEGTVARFGSRVRITAQLIDAATDRHLWARSYERELSDVLALQGEVARAIAEEIRQVTHEASARSAGAAWIRTRTRRIPRAVPLDRRSEAGIRKGIEYFEEAIGSIRSTRRPRWPRRPTTLGATVHHPEEAYTRRVAALRARDRRQSLGSARRDGVFSRITCGTGRGRLPALGRSGNAGAYHWYSDLLSALGRADEAVAMMRRSDVTPSASP
jgi:TolB-like protein